MEKFKQTNSSKDKFSLYITEIDRCMKSLRNKEFLTDNDKSLLVGTIYGSVDYLSEEVKSSEEVSSVIDRLGKIFNSQSEEQDLFINLEMNLMNRFNERNVSNTNKIEKYNDRLNELLSTYENINSGKNVDENEVFDLKEKTQKLMSELFNINESKLNDNELKTYNEVYKNVMSLKNKLVLLSESMTNSL